MRNEHIHTSLSCDYIDQTALHNQSNWHQVLIHHKGYFSKAEILDGLYDIVENELFIPVAYRRGIEIDYFFVRNQSGALNKIFEHRMQLPIKKLDKIELMIKLGVSTFKEGHISIINKIKDFILFSINTASHSGGNRVLNFENIALRPLLREIQINLGNLGTFMVFMDQLNECNLIKSSSNFRTFKFGGNSIKSLFPFSSLTNVQMDVIDLSKNNITDIDEFKYLEGLKVQELLIEGNECSTRENVEQLRSILPKLKKIDKILILATPTFDWTNIKGESLVAGNNPIPSNSFRDGVVISGKNLSQFKNFNLLRNDKCWSKVVIFHDEAFSMKEILLKLTELCINAQNFFPCYAQRFKKHDEFFLYKNFEALRLIFFNKLKIRMNHSTVYDCHLHLNIADYEKGQVDWEENIKYVIYHRIQDNKLILNNFIQEEFFLSNIFIYMGNSNILNFILNEARRITNQLTEIHLENCQILNCEGFSILSAFGNLRVLNLRNNDISHLSAMMRKGTSIRELILDENPICSQFNSVDYISIVRDHFPNLEYLDGHRIYNENSIYPFQNFIVSLEIYTAVENFITLFFALWDSFEREELIKMYAPKSMLSICMHYEMENDNMPFEQICDRIYKISAKDHNLKRISDMNKASNNVFLGREKILNVIRELSRTKHDLKNCNVDVPYYDEKNGNILLIVSGTVQDLYDNEPLILSFSRSFFLVVNDGEIFIANDQILYRNSTNYQRDNRNSFKSVHYEDLKKNCPDLLPTEEETDTFKLMMLQELTECKKDFCLK